MIVFLKVLFVGIEKIIAALNENIDCIDVSLIVPLAATNNLAFFHSPGHQTHFQAVKKWYIKKSLCPYFRFIEYEFSIFWNKPYARKIGKTGHVIFWWPLGLKSGSMFYKRFCLQFWL